jgi:hypothetical protein
MKYPRQAGFVGFNGDNVWMDPNGYPDDHPMVVAYPDMFTSIPPAGVKPPADVSPPVEQRRRGRPPGSKNRPKLETVQHQGDDDFGR